MWREIASVTHSVWSKRQLLLTSELGRSEPLISTLHHVPQTRVDCDSFDKVGCAKGLVCGADNCYKFHELGTASGFKKDTDCCECKFLRPNHVKDCVFVASRGSWPWVVAHLASRRLLCMILYIYRIFFCNICVLYSAHDDLETAVVPYVRHRRGLRVESVLCFEMLDRKLREQSGP